MIRRAATFVTANGVEALRVAMATVQTFRALVDICCNRRRRQVPAFPLESPITKRITSERRRERERHRND